MFTLSQQVQLATKTAVMCAQKLSMQPEAPNQELSEEHSFEDLRARLRDATVFLRALHERQFPELLDFCVRLEAGDFSRDFSADDYVFQFALPNFYFHIATAHGILRAQGLRIGKSEYLGSF